MISTSFDAFNMERTEMLQRIMSLRQNYDISDAVFSGIINFLHTQSDLPANFTLCEDIFVEAAIRAYLKLEVNHWLSDIVFRGLVLEPLDKLKSVQNSDTAITAETSVRQSIISHVLEHKTRMNGSILTFSHERPAYLYAILEEEIRMNRMKINPTLKEEDVEMPQLRIVDFLNREIEATQQTRGNESDEN